MIPIHRDSLVDRAVRLYQAFLSNAEDCSEGDDEKLAQQWLLYSETIADAVAAGSLDQDTASTISVIIGNVQTTITCQMALEKDVDQTVASLSNKVKTLILGDQGG